MPKTAYGRAADDTHAGSLSVGLPEWIPQKPFAAASQDLRGTVPATVGETERRSYDYSSEALIRGWPVRDSQVAAVKSSQKVRAKDLVAELDLINSQIHRMMFQVERAVARLATSG
jgi:hypothetical protein